MRCAATILDNEQHALRGGVSTVYPQHLLAFGADPFEASAAGIQADSSEAPATAGSSEVTAPTALGKGISLPRPGKRP